MTNSKPIAVISNSIEQAIYFLREAIDIKDVLRHKRLVISKDGKKYDIITTMQHIYGMQYSEVMRTPRAWENPNYEEINARVILNVRP